MPKSGILNVKIGFKFYEMDPIENYIQGESNGTTCAVFNQL